MPTENKNLERIEKIQSLLNDGVSKDEFERALEELLNLFLKLDKRYSTVIDALEGTHTKSLDDLKSKVDHVFVGERVDQLSAESRDMLTRVDNLLTRAEETIARVKDGKPGPKGDKGDTGVGLRGRDGSPDTPEQVRNKLARLTGDDRLDISTIKGLTEELQKLRQAMATRGQVGWGAHPLVVQDSGVVKSKIARNINFGTGLSVTVNSSGVITVSGTSTGYQAPTSGTINGTNTVFVFASEPNVIIVDGGRTMQKTSGDGTVNWTGTTTITLSVAPVFDIFKVA